jgi:hypothetical protein
MSKSASRGPSPAARAFASLQAEDVLLPSEASALKRSSALFFVVMVLVSAPLFWAANAAGIIGDLPTAVAHSGSSGPGSGGDDDDHSGPGGGGDDDDDDSHSVRTDDTSANGQSTRGTTDDNDTNTRMGTDDTSANGHSTRGTTNDNDTNTRMGTDDTSANGQDTRGTTNDNDTRTQGAGGR